MVKEKHIHKVEVLGLQGLRASGERESSKYAPMVAKNKAQVVDLLAWEWRLKMCELRWQISVLLVTQPLDQMYKRMGGHDSSL